MNKVSFVLKKVVLEREFNVGVGVIEIEVAVLVVLCCGIFIGIIFFKVLVV